MDISNRLHGCHGIQTPPDDFLCLPVLAAKEWRPRRGGRKLLAQGDESRQLALSIHLLVDGFRHLAHLRPELRKASFKSECQQLGDNSRQPADVSKAVETIFSALEQTAKQLIDLALSVAFAMWRQVRRNRHLVEIVDGGTASQKVAKTLVFGVRHAQVDGAQLSVLLDDPAEFTAVCLVAGGLCWP